MIFVNKMKRKLSIFIINHFLCGTHFWKIKCKLLNFGNIQCGTTTKLVGPLYIGSVANLIIGENCWVGRNFSVYGNGEVTIGDNVDIAPDVACATGTHIISDDSKHRAGMGVSCKIFIKNGVWVGARATIIGNTTIESGSVVGACSLVNKNLQENIIYAGIPARKIKELNKK